MPTVSSSHFTGTFDDYGVDTGSDGLFDYLTIDAQVQITDISKDHMVLAILEDSKGNILEFNDCRHITQTGQQNLQINFDGLQLYKNRIDGPYNLKYIQLSTISSCTGFGTPPEGEHSLEDTYSTKAYQYTQFQKAEPAIYCLSSPCTASPDLIRSRDNINMPEPNSPNTIDGCEDGSSGTYLDSESIESITITSQNSFFKTGDTVDVDIKVYCDSTFDNLNLAYTNNIDNLQWDIKDNKQCTSTGLRTFSTSFTLDNNVGQHAIRGVFGFGLSSDKVCGNGDYDDNDDLVIYVKECNQDSDCDMKECDHLDSSAAGCYQGTYRDYKNIQNTCNQDYTCTKNTCTKYDEIITDNDGDGYDTECDNDCNDTPAGFDINPGKQEICNNNIDDNCNNKIDKDDPECEGKFGIYIKEGWNLLSLPKIGNSQIEEIANIFNNDFNRILTLKGDTWYIYDKTPNSNLKQLTEEDGFWIDSDKDLTIRIDNQASPSPIFNLKKGWNIIGYPSMEERYVQDLFQEVIGDIEYLYTHNSPFTSFKPEKPTDFLIKPGMGIIVKVKNDVVWQFTTRYIKGNTTFNLGLLDGWNLISIPLISENTKSEIFGPETLYYLEDNQWTRLEDASKIDYSTGYWIKTTQDTILIGGHQINDIRYDINEGWNLINYPMTKENTVGDFFQNTINNIEQITIYDGVWKNYNPSKPSHLNTLNELQPGKGIFIKAKSNSKWKFDDNLEVE